MYKPRNGCFSYMLHEGAAEDTIEQITRDELIDQRDAGNFVDGPYKDPFGDGYGEPYNPYRQAYGKLKDGRFVFCELHPNRIKECPDGDAV